MRRRLVKDRRVQTVGRRIQYDDAACCCGDASPCDKIWHRYDPCPNDPFEFHAECQNQVRTTPVYMRCDTLCPEGCGASAGSMAPQGIKYKQWCHSVYRDGFDYAQFYDPDDPPENIPPGATPLPANAERVTRPDACLAFEGTGTICGQPCCKCWHWYCGNNCPCSGITGQQKCVRGNQAFFDERAQFNCLVGSCAEFDSPIGYDDLPPGAEEVGAQGGTCCDETKSGCPGLGLCVDCERTSGVYQWFTGGGCPDETDTGFEIPYDCCCSDLDTGIEFAYEAVKTVPEICGSPNRLSIARVRGYLPPGVPFAIATGNLHLEYWGVNGQPPPPPDDFPINLTMTRTCAPASLLDFSVDSSGFFTTGGHAEVQVQANCGLAVKTTSISGCPESICEGLRSNEIRGITFDSGGRSASCRAGCQERTSFGPQPRRKVPLPLELLG